MAKKSEIVRAYLRSYGGNYKSIAVDPDPDNERSFFYLPDNKFVKNWRPIDFVLEGKKFDDYQSCVHGLRMFSSRFKQIIDEHKTEKDKYQWLDATVTFHGETRPYHILHFYNCDDILDKNRTVFGHSKKSIVRPAFKGDIVKLHAIFSYGCDIPYVSPILRRAVLDAKMEGVAFEPTKVVQ